MSDETKNDNLEKSGDSTIKVNFPSNSKASKEPEEPINERHVKKVVTGKVIEKKKSFSKKLAEMLTHDEGSDMNSVVSYVIQDILLPSAKALVYDIITGGVEMKLFGTSSGKRSRSSRSRDGSSGKTYTSYDSISSGRNRGRDRDRDDDDRKANAERNRARHNFDDIVIKDRGDAEEVIDQLIELVDSSYGVASVADLYEMLGIPSSFTDNKFGWEDLTPRNAYAKRGRDGFILILPKPKAID